MFVIGLTGGIGTGKSEVSGILEGMGAAVINADVIGHQEYRPGTGGWREVVEAFGRDILTPDGEVDRKKLGALVFSDSEAIKRLNAIMLPRICDTVTQRIVELREQGRGVVVVEAAILLEAGWTSLVDEVWVTTAPEEVVTKRLQNRDSMDAGSVRARISSQMSQAERAQRADVIIENAGTLEELENRIKILWSSRVSPRQGEQV